VIGRLERLINLVIALRETRVPLTAGEVRERVAGYGQEDYEAFRRMLERDKADLRGLGVPVETVPLDTWGDRQGYRIDPARYDLPELAFEPEELAALAVALGATDLAAEAASGLRKLAVDAGGDDPSTQPPRVEVDLEAPHLALLMEAQVSRTPVRFDYAPAGKEAGARTVEPHALVHRSGRWYVVGHDLDRGARRAFRLDRISAPVRRAGPPGSFHVPDEPVGPEHVVPTPPAPGATALVVAGPGVAWQVARRARGSGEPLDDGRTAFQVPVGDRERFTSWVLGWGPELEVRAPAELRESIARRLRALAGVAGGGAAR
jgi:proteasome accessory factor B